MLFYTKQNKYVFNIQKDRSYLTGQMGQRKDKPVREDQYGTFQEVLFSKTVIKLYRDSRFIEGEGFYTMVNARDNWNFDAVGRTSAQRVGYPTQKPIALLERIIQASSDENAMILDPFCGCATACIAAEMLGRQWVGIDISPKAADLVKLRMKKEVGIFYTGAHRTDIPQRTDVVPILPYHHKHNKEKLYGVQGGHCNGCQEHFETRHLEIDHIVPRSKGGTDHLENLQLLCGSCNRIKGNRTHEFLISALNDKSLINLAA